MRHSDWQTLAATALASLAACAVSGKAMAADPGYPAMDAGALLRQVEQTRQANQARRDLSQLPPLAPPLALVEAQTLNVKGFRFLGARLMALESLQAAVAPFAHRALAQSDLDNLLSAVVDAYRQRGWVVRAYVPKQPLPTDTLTIQILETIPPNTPK